MQKQALATILVVTISFAPACATIINGRTQSIGISSSPAGATAIVSPAGTTVVTPSQVQLKRGSSYTVLVEKEGYESGSATVSSSASAWLLGNILLGGLIGLAVDFITGGAYKLTPETVSVTLVRALPPPPSPEEMLTTPTPPPEEGPDPAPEK